MRPMVPPSELAVSAPALHGLKGRRQVAAGARRQTKAARGARASSECSGWRRVGTAPPVVARVGTPTSCWFGGEAFAPPTGSGHQGQSPSRASPLPAWPA